VTSALLAPRLIVTIGSALQPGERGTGPRAGEIDDDLANAPIPLFGAGLPVTLQGLGCPAWRPTVARRHRQAGD